MQLVFQTTLQILSNLKIVVMKNYNASREVLLVTNSSFAQRELCENDPSEAYKMATSGHDKLEEACWNGFLNDHVPAVESSKRGGKLFLWKILVANMFLCAEFSQRPVAITGARSVNPYSLLPFRNYN